ncbi:acyl-CoA dehydrogenase family protein [Nonomuraea sediminis]|uniref:acyl-CoA dehydrogenase family protein n=1 Tax=Nonomuraea sediminis TaxID=2835864 RepID=UPI001BDD6D71
MTLTPRPQWLDDGKLLPAAGRMIGAIAMTEPDGGSDLKNLTTRAVRTGRAFVDDAIERHLRGRLDTATASMAKWWLADLQCQVGDRCLQLFGGYGYMREYLVQTPGAEDRSDEGTDRTFPMTW